MTLEIGSTHDVILHIAGSPDCGLNFKPGTYIQGYQPATAAQLGSGRLTGYELSPWKNEALDNFTRGEGQQEVLSEWNGSVRGSLGLVAVSKGQDDQGHERKALAAFPLAVKVGTLPPDTGAFEMWSTNAPMFAVPFSASPHVIHNQVLFKSLPTPAGDGFNFNLAYMSFPSPVMSVVSFTNNLWVAGVDKQIRQYNGSTITIPAWNTLATRLAVYDQKLWRAWTNKLAYLVPTATTGNWSTAYDVGEAGSDVQAVTEFGGRLYIGKSDGLYVFDAGRIYAIQKYDLSDKNFTFMKVLKGALYFNIETVVWRLTGGGVLERIVDPWNKNDFPSTQRGSTYDNLLDHTELPRSIVAGEVNSDNLYIIVHHESSSVKVLYVFDPDFGSWWRLKYNVDVIGAYGKLLFEGSRMQFRHLYCTVLEPTPAPRRDGLLTEAEKTELSLCAPVTYQGSRVATKLYKHPLYTTEVDLGAQVARAYLAMENTVFEIKPNLFDNTALTLPHFTTGLGSATYPRLYIHAPLADPAREHHSVAIELTPVAGTEEPWIWTGSANVQRSQQGFPRRTWTFAVFSSVFGVYNSVPPSDFDGVGWVTQYVNTATRIAHGWVRGAVCFTGGIRITGLAVNARPWFGTGNLTGTIRPSMIPSYPDDVETGPFKYQFSQPILVERNPLYSHGSTEPYETLDRETELDAISIDYMYSDSLKKRIQGVVAAMDGIEVQPTVIENSGQFIATTVLGAIQARTPLVVEVPWPTPHTFYARISLSDPGAMVPRIDNTQPFMGADIPIRIEEL